MALGVDAALEPVNVTDGKQIQNTGFLALWRLDIFKTGAHYTGIIAKGSSNEVIMIGGPAAPEDGEGRARTFPPHPEPAPSPTRPQAVVGSVIERMKAEAGQRGEYILISDMAVKFTETTATLAITFEEPFYANVPEPSA